MGKLLRVLVVFFLLFSIAALALGILLFEKREMLKGRTQKLEDTIITLGTFVEAEIPELEEKPTYSERDITEPTSEVIEDPEKADYWDAYKAHLELQDQETFNLATRKIQLMTYYLRDPLTEEIMRDPGTGARLTEGKGTMQELLDEVVAKTEEQLNRLNETRLQLIDLREEYIQTVDELNRRKYTLRERLRDIVNLNQTIADLEQKIRGLEDRIAELEDEKRQLQDTIRSQQETIAQLEEKLVEKEQEIEELERRIESLQEAIRGRGGEGIRGTGFARPIGPGRKGAVVDYDETWNFVILELSDDFLDELLGEDRSKELVPVELLIKRPEKPQKFVTKIRLIQIQHDHQLGIADILEDWQRLPIEKGDIVFY